MTRATVAIAFHDEEPLLPAAIRSILGQTFTDFELLLLDDGSTDRSFAVAQRFLDDPRVRLLETRGRHFLGARLNEAIAAARAEIFVRMDADDVSHPERLARQIAFLERESSCDAVGTWLAFVDENERPFGTVESAPAQNSRDVLRRGLIAHATMAARTAWLRAHPYTETLTRAEDRDLWCRTAASSRIEVLPEVLYVARVLPRRAGFLEDYTRGQADLRRVIRQYGPALVGRRETARLAVGVYLREAAMRAAFAAGLHERLVRRRGRALTAEERTRVEEALRQRA